MDFARKILQNYGWKEGDGLGKNKHGIVKPLRATLKFDNAGFGADEAAADFNNHWWDRVFNEAASNVNIQHDGEQIKMSLKCDEDGVEISTKGYSMKKLKKLKKNRGKYVETKTGYENFLQAATLTNTGGEVENPDKIDAHDIEVSKIKVLTDDELFKACGGRTAHKGARHGLKLSGKLSRIEQQETELLSKILVKRNCLSSDASSNKLEKKCTKADDSHEQTEKECKKNKLSAKVVKDGKINQRNNKRKPTEECKEDEFNETSKDITSDVPKKKQKKSEKGTVMVDHVNEVFVNKDMSQEKSKNDEVKLIKNKKNKGKFIDDEIEHTVHKKKKKSK